MCARERELGAIFSREKRERKESERLGGAKKKNSALILPFLFLPQRESSTFVDSLLSSQLELRERDSRCYRRLRSRRAAG